jgi:hypothetical protein
MKLILTDPDTNTPVLINDNWTVIIPDLECEPDEKGRRTAIIYFDQKSTYEERNNEKGLHVGESIEEIAEAVRASYRFHPEMKPVDEPEKLIPAV